jgi:hypothetical protein
MPFELLAVLGRIPARLGVGAGPKVENSGVDGDVGKREALKGRGAKAVS